MFHQNVADELGVLRMETVLLWKARQGACTKDAPQSASILVYA